MSESADPSEAKPVEVPAGPIIDVRLEVPERVDESTQVQGSDATPSDPVVIIVIPEPSEKSGDNE